MSRAYYWLNDTLPVWAKVVLVMALFFAVFLPVGYVGLLAFDKYIPANKQDFAVVAFVLLLIFWRLDSIAQTLRDIKRRL